LLAFPGGKVEEQDEISHCDVFQTAVKREVLEEVGLILEDPLTYVTTSYFTGNHEIPVIDVLFHCRLEKTCPDVKPSRREVANYYWMDAMAINQAENAPEWLKHYISLMPAS
jgi:NUDIX domain.